MPELIIKLQRKIAGLDPEVSGEALSESEPILERLAKRLNVVPLMAFYSQNPVEAAAFIKDQGIPTGEIELPEEIWYSSAQGLQTVQVLRDHLQVHPASVPNAMDVLAELTEWKRVLMRAAQEGVPWHLGVDL